MWETLDHGKRGALLGCNARPCSVRDRNSATSMLAKCLVVKLDDVVTKSPQNPSN
jgi:hypothetical protein